MWYREYFPRSRPIAAKGGIKAQSKKFGQSWWAKRWIGVLEDYGIGARLSRGRSYARNGQVLKIDIDKGVVEAKVQGSRPKPYEITIKVKTLSPADWKSVARELARQALFAAKLLAGEMPEDIETAFDKAKVPLFPRHKDLATDCSCPDWSKPCKHLAAVYYLIGEEFDRDPFLIFKLRGLSRDELIKLLGHGGKAKPARQEASGKPRKKAANKAAAAAETPAQPLAAHAAPFWTGAALPGDFFGPVERPPVAASLPKKLGNFPFWRGTDHFLDAMESIYRAASERGLETFLGNQANVEP